MSDSFDPRPLLERPAHWRYGVCGWQHRYQWDERVAMSELGIGPEEAPLNPNGLVQSVHLGHRELPDSVLSNLSAFTEMRMIYLVGTAFTDDCLSYLAACPSLEWVWVGDTPMTEAALRKLERQRPDMFVMRSGEGAIPDGKGGWRKL